MTSDSENAHDDAQRKLTGTEGQIDRQPAFHGDVTLQLSRGDVTVHVDHETFDVEREREEEFDYVADPVLTGGDIHADGQHDSRTCG